MAYDGDGIRHCPSCRCPERLAHALKIAPEKAAREQALALRRRERKAKEQAETRLRRFLFHMTESEARRNLKALRRRLEILVLHSDGKTYSEIGEHLGISGGRVGQLRKVALRYGDGNADQAIEWLRERIGALEKRLQSLPAIETDAPGDWERA